MKHKERKGKKSIGGLSDKERIFLTQFYLFGTKNPNKIELMKLSEKTNVEPIRILKFFEKLDIENEFMTKIKQKFSKNVSCQTEKEDLTKMNLNFIVNQ